MFFRDRDDAARQLAQALGEFCGRNPLVLAIPRGGVPLGRILADALNGQLDIVLVRKLCAPYESELAIGSVDEGGGVHLESFAAQTGATDTYLQEEIARQRKTLQRRRTIYCGQAERADPGGRTVIVVDDGLATGATMAAALEAVRAGRPARLVCAAPVAASSAVQRMAPLADDVVCLHAVENMFGISQFYGTFEQLDDATVVELLRHRSMPVR